jgi:hypothetical protein
MANFTVNNNISFKAGYFRNYQYLHMLSPSTVGPPQDVWMPSSINIKPFYCDQVSLGYFQNLKENTYSFSMEVFYKKLYHIIDYKIGADIVLNEASSLMVKAGLMVLNFTLKRIKEN